MKKLPAKSNTWIILLAAFLWTLSAYAEDETELLKLADEVTHIGITVTGYGAFRDASPITGELSDKSSAVFVIYERLAIRPKKLDPKFGTRLKENLKVDRPVEPVTAVLAMYHFVLYNAKMDPLLLVGIRGSTPVSISKVHKVDETLYQADSSGPVLRRTDGKVFRMFEPFLAQADGAKKALELLSTPE